jgi:translocation and assembly module TamB
MAAGATILIAVPILAFAIALIAANTDPGRRLIERSVEQLAGDTVRIKGLSGRFPDDLQIARIDIADLAGPYAQLRDITIRWSPTRLLSGRVDVSLLEAQQVDLARLPASTGQTSDAPPFPPLRLALARLSVVRLNLGDAFLGDALLGHPISLQIDGRTDIASPRQGSVELTLTDLTRSATPGTYRLSATLNPDGLRATLTAAEASGGLIGTLAGLPDIGAVTVDGLAEGPLDRVKASLSATAGPLSGSIHGTMDTIGMTGDLAVSVTAPTMRPNPNLSWDSVALGATVRGSLTRPDANGTLDILGLRAGEVTVRAIHATIVGDPGVGNNGVGHIGVGNTGQIELNGRLDGTRIPGPSPSLLAASPIMIDATARLDAPGHPIRFAIRHALVSIEGRLAGPVRAGTGADNQDNPPEAVPRDQPAPFQPAPAQPTIGGAIPTGTPRPAPTAAPPLPPAPSLSSGPAITEPPSSATVTVTIPDIQSFTSLAGFAAPGRAKISLSATRQAGTTSLHARGLIGIPDGASPLPALVGDTARIDLAATVRDTGTVTLHTLTIAGRTLQASASGRVSDQRMDLDWTLRLSDLAAVQPGLAGHMEMRGKTTGPLTDLALTADLSGEVAAIGQVSGPIIAHLDVTSLTAAPNARLTAEGQLLGAPMTLAMAVVEELGSVRVSIDRADWKSVHADGAISLRQEALSGESVPTGAIRLTMARLADLTPLLGQSVEGSLDASPTTDRDTVRLSATLRDAALAGSTKIAQTTLQLAVIDPLRHPITDGLATFDRIAVGDLRGSARLSARGPLSAIALTLSADAARASDPTVRLQSAGLLDIESSALTLASLKLASLKADWKDQTIRLLAPARFGFGDGVTVDRMRLGYRQAELALSGRIVPALDLTATLRNLPGDIAALIAPDLAAEGTIAADMRLTGRLDRPEGTVKVTASSLRMRTGPGRALPVANLVAQATLQGHAARIDLRGTAGASKLTIAGAVPLASTTGLDLHAGGTVDLTMLNPLLAAQGRRVKGMIDLDTTIKGSFADPKLGGVARVTGGEVQDSAIGARISNIDATIQADGGALRLIQMTGRAGPGRVDIRGTIGLTDGMPIDLRINATQARPLSSDLVSALIDADLTVTGRPNADMTIGGTLRVTQADIRIPERLPSSIVTIPVRIAGAPSPTAPTAPTPSPRIGLNLVLDAPGRIFVRGRGLDAELGGKVVFQGTLASPQPVGGLALRRGTFSVVGQTLSLTSGTIDFAGAGLTNPSLLLVATSARSGLTTNLTISGSVRDPLVKLSSTPDMPQDEILARLLFDNSTAKLSPFQIAQLAAGLASLSGATSGFGDPLDNLRRSFGLDRLSVGSSASGAPALEAGRYLAPGVYLGARQSASGGGTEATVQIDIAKGLKLETTVGNGTGSATGSGSGTDSAKVGITYQLEY